MQHGGHTSVKRHKHVYNGELRFQHGEQIHRLSLLFVVFRDKAQKDRLNANASGLLSVKSEEGCSEASESQGERLTGDSGLTGGCEDKNEREKDSGQSISKPEQDEGVEARKAACGVVTAPGLPGSPCEPPQAGRLALPTGKIWRRNGVRARPVSCCVAFS